MLESARPQYRNFWHGLRSMVREEGARALTKGLVRRKCTHNDGCDAAESCRV